MKVIIHLKQVSSALRIHQQVVFIRKIIRNGYAKILLLTILAVLISNCEKRPEVRSDNPAITPIDSLETLLTKRLTDRDKVDVLVQLSEVIGTNDSAAADQYIEDAIELSGRIDYPLAESKARGQRGWLYFLLGHLEASEKAYSSLMNFSQDKKQLYGEALASNGFGILNWNRGNREKSLEYHTKALQIRSKIDDKRGLAWSYNNIGTILTSFHSYDSAHIYFSHATTLFDELGQSKNKRTVFENRGYAYRQDGEYDSALWYYQQALEISEINNNEHQIGYTLNTMGLLQNSKGDYEKALAYYFRALEIERKLDRKIQIGWLLNNIGLAYQNRKENDKAMNYFEEALEMHETANNPYGECIVVLNIGIIYEDQRAFDRALNNYHKALALALAVEDKANQALVLSNIGFINTTLEQYDTAIFHLSRSVELYEELGNKSNISFSLRSLGMAYRLAGDLDSAKRYVLRALEIAKESGSTKFIRDGALELSIIEHALGNDREAFKAQSLYIEMKDSLDNDELTRNITRLEAEYEFSKEKRELEFTNQLQTERAEKAVKDRNILIIVAVVAIIFMAAIIYLVNTNRIKQKQARGKISKQSEELGKLNHLNTRILGVLSHDLRSPLFALQNTIALFEAERIDEEQLQERTRKLNIKLSDTSFFMDNLLRWAQDQLNELKPEIEHSNLKDLVEESIAILKPIARDKGVILNNYCEASHQANVDKKMAQIIIRNLVSNAIKYSQTGDSVTLDSTLDEKEAVVLVKDQGVGIPEGVMRELFADKGVKSTQGTNAEIGTGLGLMLAKEFAAKFKGVLEVTSELKKGSTFKLRVPV